MWIREPRACGYKRGMGSYMREGLVKEDLYHAPQSCPECGGSVVFKGVGEYKCERCGAVAYDDYGIVHMYLENHRGANAAEVEAATGVSQRSIRQMLKDSRLEVADGSRVALRCEACGQPIRSGRYCPRCEVEVHRAKENEKHEKLMKNAQGFGSAQRGDEGQKRFVRE